jgi:hypothetical protein
MLTTTNEVTKEEVLKALQDLPDKKALPEAIERLYILYKLQKGIEDADAGKVISHEEAKKQFRQWIA